MKSLVLIDSSVLCEWLEIPRHSNNLKVQEVRQELDRIVKNGATLFIPLTAIVEVGNLIAGISDGKKRRHRSTVFVNLLKKCFEEERPFATIALWERKDVSLYVDRFVENATREVSMGDTSLICEFEKLCEANPTAIEIRIWTTDGHLDSYRIENPIG